MPALSSVSRLGCLVLAEDDDAGNVDAALRLREKQPELPLVVRVFDAALEHYLSRTSPEIAVLSMSQVATPSLAELVGDAPTTTLGLTAWLRTFTAKIDGLALGTLGLTIALTLAGTLFFSATMGLPWSEALYFVVTTITTTGYGDITPKEHPIIVKLAANVFMVLGAATFALFFAIISEWTFARRLDVMLGRVPTRWSHHVVLVGAGNMSVRLADVLRTRGQRALVIEQNPESSQLSVLRAQGHQVLVADATNEPTLRLAGADRARAVLVLTSRDAVNLHIALVAQRIAERATIWARIDSSELARHVTEHSPIQAGSPLMMAAREFTRRAIELVRAA